MGLPPRNPLVEHQLVTVLTSEVLPTLVVMVVVNTAVMRVIRMERSSYKECQ